MKNGIGKFCEDLIDCADCINPNGEDHSAGSIVKCNDNKNSKLGNTTCKYCSDATIERVSIKEGMKVLLQGFERILESSDTIFEPKTILEFISQNMP